jgi:NADH-quinone oxidoreductase subunit A
VLARRSKSPRKSALSDQKLALARLALQATLRCDTPAAVGAWASVLAPDRLKFSKFATPARRARSIERADGSELISPGRIRVRARTRAEAHVPSLISDYLPLVVFIALGALISGALLVAPFVVAYKSPDAEKLSAYECGFNPFDDARMKFDVRFYLVSLLFIIFDLEVAFLFPWALAFHDIGAYGFWSMIIFLGVLTIGFVYEWNKGALEWD